MKSAHGLGLAFGTALLLAAQAAAAQDQFGEQGQFAVSAERLFGVVRSSDTAERNDVESTRSYTTISLLSNRLGGFSSAYSHPRVGGDYFVIDSLSLGAALGYFTTSGSVETEGANPEERDTGTISGWVFAPRVGYAFMYTDLLGIWPRAGITLVGMSTEDEDGENETSGSRLALTLEAPLVITPVEHVALSIGPTLDLGLSGSDDDIDINGMGVRRTVEVDHKTTEFGLQAGLTVWF